MHISQRNRQFDFIYLCFFIKHLKLIMIRRTLISFTNHLIFGLIKIINRFFWSQDADEFFCGDDEFDFNDSHAFRKLIKQPII